LYLADSANYRVRKISSAGIITTYAGNGTDCCYSGDSGLAINAQFNTPAGVAAGSDGTVYIAGTFNNRIRKIDPSGVITTIAGTGTPFPESGDGGPAVNARLAWPTGIKLDASGNLYIADAANPWTTAALALPPPTSIITPGAKSLVEGSGCLSDLMPNGESHLAIDSQHNALFSMFGGFEQLALGTSKTRVSTLSLYVDGKKIATKGVTYGVPYRQ
jgi:hypothetical protein